MSQSTYTSAVQRLAIMPEVFTGGDLGTLFGWKSAIASNYLANWRKSGLIRSLGGRSDVHMNLVRNRQINPDMALRRAYPNAVKVGVDVLREAGWTTQISTTPEVAVPTATALYAVQDFELTTRTDKWFLLAAPGIEKVAQGIHQLKPAWALADMLARAQDSRIKKAWLLDPEDIDLEMARRDKETLQAMQAFKASIDGLSDSGYERIYEDWQTRQASNQNP
jgi:hypothetical protein